MRINMIPRKPVGRVIVGRGMITRQGDLPDPPPDTDPPVITLYNVGPQVDDTLPTDLTVEEENTPMTLHTVAVALGAGAPSAAQILAGQDSTGAAAQYWIDGYSFSTDLVDEVIAPDVDTITTGNWDFYSVVRDPSLNTSLVASSLNVSYTAPSGIVTFTAANGTLLTAYTGEDGEPWGEFSGVMGNSPVIQNNRLFGVGADTSYWGQTSRTPAAERTIKSVIGIATQQNGERVGPALYDIANDVLYWFRYSAGNNRFTLWAASGNGGTPTGNIWSGDESGVAGGSYTWNAGVEHTLELRMSATKQLTAFIDGTAVDGNPFDRSTDNWVSGIGGFRFEIENGTTGQGFYADNFENVV